MKQPTALLIGNDINSLSPGYDWAQVLKDLIDFIGAQGKIVELREQFPLLYEEICIHAEKHGSKTEGEIKRFIAVKVQELSPNDIHSDLLQMGINEILTTNYEYTLEKSISPSSFDITNKGVVAEKRYSLFRNVEAEDIRFWHIHGDANSPNSIALGYEHYSGYLQNMRNYVVSGTKDSYRRVRLTALQKRLKSGSIESVRSWLDVFFTHDVHIVGLGLDFVEIHLWWLLTYRARTGNGRNIPIKNKVIYYYPTQREDLDRIKLRFLQANNVVLQACDRPGNDKHAYYRNVIRKLKRNIRTGR